MRKNKRHVNLVCVQLGGAPASISNLQIFATHFSNCLVGGYIEQNHYELPIRSFVGFKFNPLLINEIFSHDCYLSMRLPTIEGDETGYK